MVLAVGIFMLVMVGGIVTLVLIDLAKEARR